MDTAIKLVCDWVTAGCRSTWEDVTMLLWATKGLWSILMPCTCAAEGLERSSHFGVSTMLRLRQRFYWSQQRRDVVDYCPRWKKWEMSLGDSLDQNRETATSLQRWTIFICLFFTLILTFHCLCPLDLKFIIHLIILWRHIIPQLPVPSVARLLHYPQL